jgi:cytochrome P450
MPVSPSSAAEPEFVPAGAGGPQAGRPLPRGPRGQFLLGNLRESRRDPLAYFTKVAHDYGPVVMLQMAHVRTLVLTDPALIEQVLVTDNRLYVKHFYIRLVRHLLHNDGLLTSEGDFWRRQRRLAQPAFHRQRINNYAEVMVEHGERLLARWHDGETRDVHADMMDVTMQIVGQALLSADVSGAADTVTRSMQAVLESFEDGANMPLLVPDFVPTAANRRMRRARKELDDLIYGIIAERQRTGEDRGDLLSMLIAARDEGDGAGMSAKQLHDEVVIIFLAGHETTANALSWTWYLLAQNPQVERRLHAEVDAALAGRPPALSDLPRLRYTEMVLTESLRLYPPAWAVGREPVQDVNIGEYRVPKGTTVVMPQWVVHRDARYYADPLAFVPERWSGDFAKRLPKYAYFPFGGGPRLCIGNSFAMMEGTLLLATIAREYQLALCPGQEVTPWPSLTLRPKGGLQMVLHRRQASGAS